MAVIAILSAKGSPGVTTTALACTLSWTGPILLAECDPAGGDIRAGFLSRVQIPPIGLLPLAAAQLRGQHDQWRHQLIDLDAGTRGRRLLLPGITDPVQAGTVQPVWDQLAAQFVDLEHTDGIDVIADCGRLTTTTPPWPLLLRADLILLVIRSGTLRAVSPALPAAALLHRELTGHGRRPGPVTLLLIGDRGPYRRREIEHRLRLPVLAQLPYDRRAARVLSDGGRLTGSPPLLRAAAALEPIAHGRIHALRAHAAATTPGAGHG